jgi:hypothetical protein
MKLILLLASAAAGYGACLPVAGGRITAADLAPAVPAFAQLPPELELGFAPNPGLTRVFAPAELNQRLSRYGIQTTASEPVCVEWPMRMITDEDIRSAMLSVLPAGSEIEIASPTQISVPPGPLEFPLNALRNGMWRGYVVYDAPRRFPVTMQVKVSVPWTRVIATAPIRAGERITEANVQLRSGMGDPSGEQFAVSMGILSAVFRGALSARAPPWKRQPWVLRMWLPAATPCGLT